MKHAFSFLPGPSPEHLEIGYCVEIDKSDEHLLKGRNGSLKFEIEIYVPFPLLEKGLQEWKTKTLPFQGRLELNGKWTLAENLEHRFCNVRDLRHAYVFQRALKHAIEDVMILQVPMAPFHGLVQTFDVRMDVPKEILNFEKYRRSIIVRPR